MPRPARPWCPSGCERSRRGRPRKTQLSARSRGMHAGRLDAADQLKSTCERANHARTPLATRLHMLSEISAIANDTRLSRSI